ncbi:NADH-quinone oxidoreductase subunit L [Streptomonospora nanhaiensis]|uniref:NADH-quinone oxidoreductase subunit L n=1 Tax=Streptomonospora nanhaiensis TaxID=1323731 RepID=A0A853BLE4_9ACTN|nr:NADH-quinone oxidoreductase subunit L [Streptomonospora nanhaiensis]MBX9387985.1 NADH-quinone oxidoreductase subunit L [Streptomonospora nanhaiensis]NYI96379.1 NADH-quinone oxidoreductase subunit L [Streptomonospora nanhaiensis]
MSQLTLAAEQHAHAVTTEAGGAVLENSWLLIALPLVGAAILLLGGRRTNAWGHWLAVALPLASFGWAVAALLQMLGAPPEERSYAVPVYTWFSVGGFDAEVGLLLDPLSISFALLITGVGSLIHIYSVGYMAHDDRRRRFFAYLNLFVAAMLVLVLADNYALLFLGWEGVGLASYLLIGFWQHKDSAAVAAKKAFLVNRVGDMGLLIAIMLMFTTFGTVAFHDVFGAAGEAGQGLMTAIGLLLLLGACGKSAQLPLQSWLLDAMEGPTPVSALIHAATMVTAGVYLIVRSGAVFEAAPAAQLTVAIVGAATLLAGAVIGCAKDDIKKALAGSTMSQIGYMTMAAGLGPIGYAAAIAHLITHGFFKAGLFLGAGSVMHGMNDEVDMRRYGGLRTAMPVTFATFGLGYLAIIGFPLLSGWWTKEGIIAAAFDSGGAAGTVFGAAALLGAGLTAFYMTRVMIMTFFGTRRWADDAHPHESPASMTVPMIVLAVGSVALGAVLVFGYRFAAFLEPAIGAPEHHHAFSMATMLTSWPSLAALGLMVAGVATAWFMYGRREVPRTAPRAGLVTAAARNELYGNAINEGLLMRPGQQVARALAAFDTSVVDGLVNGIATSVRDSSRGLRGAQTGFARTYALTMLFGAAIVVATLAVRI